VKNMNRSFAGGEGFGPPLEEKDNGVAVKLHTFNEKQKLKFSVECEEKVNISGNIKCQATDLKGGKPFKSVECSTTKTGATCKNIDSSATIKKVDNNKNDNNDAKKAATKKAERAAKNAKQANPEIFKNGGRKTTKRRGRKVARKTKKYRR